MAVRDLWREWEKKVERVLRLGRKPPNRPAKRWLGITRVGGSSRRISKAFYKVSQAEAWVARQKMLELQGELGLKERREIGFATVSRLFLDEKEHQRAKRTFEHYYHQIRAHLEPFFGDVSVDRIQRSQVIRYIHDRLAGRTGGRKAVHARTVNKEVATLRRVLKYARINDYYLPADPTTGINEIKSVPKKKIRFLSDADIDRFLAVCSPAAYTFYLTAFDTGMRKNELFHLLWSWIDWDRDVIRVTQSDRFHTKSHQERDIPMTARLRAHLASLGGPREGLVLASHPSEPGSRTGFRYRLKILPDLIKKAGLVPFTLHDARHTYASRLVQRGVPLYTVSKLLGHKDVKTTQIYAHLAPEHLKDAVRLLERPIRGGAPEVHGDPGK